MGQRKAEGQAKTAWAITGKRAASFEFSGQLRRRIINDSERLGHLMGQLFGIIQTQNWNPFIKCKLSQCRGWIPGVGNHLGDWHEKV